MLWLLVELVALLVLLVLQQLTLRVRLLMLPLLIAATKARLRGEIWVLGPGGDKQEPGPELFLYISPKWASDFTVTPDVMV